MTARHSWNWSPRILTAALLLLAGCASEDKDEQSLPEPPGELVASDKQRAPSPNVPAEDVAAVVAGNTDFGAALYRQSTRPGENFFFSPYSITQAFAMTYAGARGNTEAQMAQALRFVSQDRFHPALNALDLALQDRAEHPKGKGAPPTLRVVNALWGQKGRTFEPAFLDTLAVNYGAGMRVVDFSTESESIRSRINDWVKERTEGRIQGLLPEGSVRPDTRLVMANALYFKGAWAVPFNDSGTHGAPFRRLDGSEQQVQMMAGADGFFPYGKGDGYEAVALPYAGQSFRMLLVIPDSGRFTEVESRLSASFLSEVRSKLETDRLFLQMPKFRVETEFSLVERLNALGLVDAFTDAADLSGMTKEEALLITAAQHKAFVAVDEKGTEAAAATAVVSGPASMPPELVVDRPFLFLIEDVDTQAVLFLGRIVNPGS
ncbi:serpin family protein [Pyxidicoccus fallax]|uniref:Serpin family protein n=1 Tax=Pyxidicoccus fallax TaxID=394095 RepID=A0A848LLX4_9BACT|nr:serpin family protein [Pyxidicoccus fallax]NMO18746.1 serpin family protein [Pyxidicoccus fallax]NPC79203.1 serpin family protein [Pyxidicoccus fallax]